jgi:uncharacterized protein (DUF305 family)
MNANELADGLETATNNLIGKEYELAGRAINFYTFATTMLRQQQSEIAELKHMNRNWQISENILLLELEKLQHRELTDEEIEEIGKQYLSAHAQFIGAGECHYEGEIEFARAILRKAQEK